MFKDYFKGIWRDRYILLSLVRNDLQMKYRRSFLGIAWAVLTPLGLVLIIGSVYSIIFGSDPTVFIPLLFAGLNPWLFMSATADGGTNAFIGAEGYLKQTAVNAQIFPLRVVLVNFVNLMYSIIAFFAAYLFLQPDKFGVYMLMLLPGLLLMFLFTLSLANIVAVINLHLRDYQPLQSLIIQGLFYVTPIIYEPQMLQEKGFDFIYRINPFYYFLEIVRRPMLGYGLPDLGIYRTAVGIACIAFLMSIILVMRTKRGIAFKL